MSCTSHDLPFVKVNPDADIHERVNWFAVQSTGDYALDCKVGSECAYALIEHLRNGSESMGTHYRISDVVRSMLKRDDLKDVGFNGLIVGFMSTIGLCFVKRAD